MNNRKYIIIVDQNEPEQVCPAHTVERIVRFMEESGVFEPDYTVGEPEMESPLDRFAHSLIMLTDQAELYRDMLNYFIDEADALLEELDILTDGADELE